MAVSQNQSGESSSVVGTAITIQELEKQHIAGVLDNTKWNKNLTAKILDISLKTLYTKIQQYNLKEKE